jgi:hypothetical protein
MILMNNRIDAAQYAESSSGKGALAALAKVAVLSLSFYV